jgi:hypothetical protein
MGYADDFRAAGLTDAADIMEIFATQEGHHAATPRWNPWTLPIIAMVAAP